MFFFLKQKTAYEMRFSDWSSDVCSSDLSRAGEVDQGPVHADRVRRRLRRGRTARLPDPRARAVRGPAQAAGPPGAVARSPPGRDRPATDRKRVVQGKSGSVRVELGGRRSNKKKKQINLTVTAKKI